MASGYPYHHEQQMGHSTTNTVVVVQQPTATVVARDWSSGVYNCCDDVGICLCGVFCGICLAMKTSGDLNETQCLPCCVPYFMIPLRTKLRIQENIVGSICDDCLMNTFCGTCTLCQLAREVKMIKARDQRVAMIHK